MYHADIIVNLMVKKVIQNKKWNNDKFRCKCKKHHICEKGCIWDLAACSGKDSKYLASIIDDSLITYDEIIDMETKTVTTNFNEKNVICKIKNIYISLAFSLITIALLIPVTIYYYLIKYKAKKTFIAILRHK